ncbi:MAG: hypothetical protein ABI643_00545 [Candidatus Doudnabacteria bacterium]
MRFRKKWGTKIILAVVVVLGFLYWHGLKNITAKGGMSCNYHLAYALCTLKNNKAQLPGLWDILTAGVKF